MRLKEGFQYEIESDKGGLAKDKGSGSYKRAKANPDPLNPENGFLPLRSQYLARFTQHGRKMLEVTKVSKTEQSKDLCNGILFLSKGAQCPMGTSSFLS